MAKENMFNDELLEKAAIASATLGAGLLAYMLMLKAQQAITKVGAYPDGGVLTVPLANYIIWLRTKADENSSVGRNYGPEDAPEGKEQRIVIVEEERYTDPETGKEMVHEHGVIQLD